NASHQVLILSTDTEVDRHYYQALQPHIARAYHLRYDEESRFTHGEEGYFWDGPSSFRPWSVVRRRGCRGLTLKGQGTRRQTAGARWGGSPYNGPRTTDHGRRGQNEHQSIQGVDPGQGAAHPAEDPDEDRALERALPLGVLPVAPPARAPGGAGRGRG